MSPAPQPCQPAPWAAHGLPRTLRSGLLGSTALVAVALTVLPTAPAGAIDLTTAGITVTSTTQNTADGLRTPGTAPGTADTYPVTIDSNGGAITLGADSTPSVLTLTGGNAETVTITVTHSGTAGNGVTFADDITGAGTGDTITINATNDDVTFQGNVTSQGGAINLGDANADPTLTATFDTANTENLTIDALINAVDASDTITVQVSNSGNAANTITFSKAIGGTIAIDTLNVGASTTATFSSTIDAGTINIASTNTTTFNDDVTGNVNFNADGTASFAAGKKIVGNVTTGTTGQGTLTFANATANTTLVSGTVGATGSALKALTVGADTGSTATLGGNVFANTVTVNGAGTTQFDNVYATNLNVIGTGTFKLRGGLSGNLNYQSGATAEVSGREGIVGNVTTNANDQGILNLTGDTTYVKGTVGATGTKLHRVNVNDGIASFYKNISSTLTTIASGATLKTTAAVTHDGTLTNNGTLDLGGTLTVASGSTLNLGATSGATLKLASASSYTNNVVIDATSATAVSVATDATVNVDVPDGFTGRVTLIDGNGTNVPAADKFSSSRGSNLLATYTISSDSNDLIFTATENPIATIASQIGTAPSAATALKAAYAAARQSGGAVATAYQTAITGGASVAKMAAEQSEPNTIGATPQVAMAVPRAVVQSVSSRLSALRGGVQTAGLIAPGVAAGAPPHLMGLWAKAFGGVGTQDRSGSNSGYDMSNYGVAFGTDGDVGGSRRVGAAISLGRTRVKGDSSAASKSHISSHMLTLYGSTEGGSYEAPSHYIEGQISYGQSQVENTRRITFAGQNSTAQGKYTATQLNAAVTYGAPQRRGAYTITPHGGLFYAKTEGKQYTETGAGALNQVVNPPDIEILEVNAGVSAIFNHKVNGGMVRPEVRAQLAYNLAEDIGATTARYVGSTTSFSIPGQKTSKLSGTLGAGITTLSNDGTWELSADYDLDIRSGYFGHGGMVKARINF